MRAVLGVLLLGTLSFVGCGSSGDAGDAHDDVVESGEDQLASNTIQNYAAVSPPETRATTGELAAKLGPKIAGGRKIAVIRTLTFQEKKARLVVDAESMKTSLVDEDALNARSQIAGDGAATTPYLKTLAELTASNKALVSIDGEANTGGANEPFALTIDMCQSRKPWDKRLYEWIVALSDKVHEPIPVGIAMTGGWAKNHTAELDQIVSWQTAGKLDITWINHSSTHPLHCLNESCSRAEFLTNSSVDFNEEVFGLERALLARGMVPSVIFRFPGLVHNEARMKQLAKLSLMAVDADAWIAKGQGIKPRAVVLVHGNGNEPPGIDGFLRAVNQPERAANLASGKSALVSPLLIAPSPPR